MPRRKHYFPVSHDINNDPEVWELTDTFGDWLLFVWLEILSVADRSEGYFMGAPSASAVSLSRFCRGVRRDKDSVRRRFKGTNAAYRVELALYWMTLKRWILPVLVTDDGHEAIKSWPNHSQMVAEWYANGARMVAEWSVNGTRMVVKSSANGQGMVAEWWPNGSQIIGFKTRNHTNYHRTKEHKEIPGGEPNVSPPTYPTSISKRDSAKRALESRKKTLTEYKINPAIIDWCDKNQITPTMAKNEIGRYIDWHLAHRDYPQDNDAAFRNWLRKAKEFNPQKNQGQFVG